MPNVLGIDLGTANSAVSATLNNGDITRTFIPHDGTLYGDNVIPSYLAFSSQGEITAIGLNARNMYFNGSGDYIFRHIKRLIGRTYDYVEERIRKNHAPFLEFKGRINCREDGFISFIVGPKEISVTEMVSYLIKKLYNDAKIEAGKYGETIDSVVISLPAGTGDFQRQETLKASVLAGINKEIIRIIEEPTAAAVAKGLYGTMGKIIVIDVGAGTTDVVIGYIAQVENNISMQLTSRECDDLLGGMDMDYLILEYVLHRNPELKTIYENLPAQEQYRLTGRIEDAKINTVRDGHGTVAAVLVDNENRKIRVRADFDETELNKIINPIINGFAAADGRKGIKVVIENALLQSAGGKSALVPQVIEELEHIILVGGPCRMAAMFDMLCDVFASNKNIVNQLNSLRDTRLEDKFYMEGVSKGDAFYKGLSINGELPSVMTITNETINVFNLYEGGTTPVVLSGTPYETSQGIVNKVQVKVHENANHWWILREKESGDNKNRKIRRCDVSDHIIILPQSGELEVSYKFGTAGTDNDVTTIEGCGLQKIVFPKRQKVSTLGKMLEEKYIGFLGAAKKIQGLVETAREHLCRYLVEEKGLGPLDAKQAVDRTLPQGSLENCRQIQIDEGQELSEDEIKLALEKGLVKMREGTAIDKGLLTSSDIEAMDITIAFSIPNTRTEMQELIGLSHYLLTIKPTPGNEQYFDQLTSYLKELEKKPSRNIAATTATALMVLADVLYDGGAIPKNRYEDIKYSCVRFRLGQ